MRPISWQDWHSEYDDPRSRLARRLALVQERIALALDTAPPGPLRAVSMCAGQGRDLLGVLPDHPRRDDVTARLVELDPALSGTARQAARAAGLAGVEVLTGDASTTDAYAGLAPAHLVLVCGVYGNVSEDDVRSTVGLLPTLCARGATVVWTRHRRHPDLLPAIVGWMAEAGFTDPWTSADTEDTAIGVATGRYAGPPRPFEPGRRLFTFARAPGDASPRR